MSESATVDDLNRPVRSRTSGRALVEVTRPRQWIKNLLVAAAPLAAGRLFAATVFGPTAAALVSFVLASAAVYVFNDLRDATADRHHAVKRMRPIARGDVTVRAATVTAALCVAGALAIPLVIANWPLLAVVATYLAVMVSYSLGLKHEPVLDLVIVASGFFLRALAGGVAADIPLSRWFLIVTTFGSLYVVAGKRYSELVALGEDAPSVRRAHASYTPTYLRFVWTSAASVLLATYCLWAFEMSSRAHTHMAAPWPALSIAPFLVGLLRYSRDVDLGAAGEPEEILFRDRTLQAVALVWLIVFMLGAAGV